MEKWEYHTMHLSACIRNPGVQEYVTQRWPDWTPPQYAPELLIPELNKLGANGWELISIQPVVVKPGGDHHIPGQTSQVTWDYLAVFKRRVE